MKKLITMLSALTITSSIVPLTVACGAEESGIDLTTITADMILNWETEYKGINEKNEDLTVTSEKLGSLKNDDIERLLSDNLRYMIVITATGIDKAKFMAQDISKFSEEELSKIANFGFLMRNVFYAGVKAEKDTKIFKAIIEVPGWDVTNKDDKLKKLIDEEQKVAKEFLDKSDEDKKTAVSSHDKMSPEEIEEAVKNRIGQCRVSQKLSLDQVKTMYDSMKGKDKKIEISIDLTSKQ